MRYGRCKLFTLYWCPLLLQAPASSSSPPAAASSVSLADVSVQEVSAILENLSFSTLVDPFRRNGISGKSINRFRSHEDIMGLDKAGINEVVALTFYEDYVVNWKASKTIPKDLLLQLTPTNSNLKVCIQYVCMYGRLCLLLCTIKRLLIYTSALIIF